MTERSVGTSETEGASPDAVRTLLSARAVRERARTMLGLAQDGHLLHCAVDMDRLPLVADYVVDTIRGNYPTLAIPFHARWRHFAVGGHDRWGVLAARTTWRDAAAKARAAFDLAIVSVLLDAGAGPIWRYREDETGEAYARSEGLAVASLRMFETGLFSATAGDPLRADAKRLRDVTGRDLAAGFKVNEQNALVGLEGRAALLYGLGTVAAARPEVFARADGPRPGGLFDALVAEGAGGEVPAELILHMLLAHLSAVWPARLTIAGIELGDTWMHPLMPGDGGTTGLVPFHKLSQWLAYSLIEPLEEAGLAVTGIDGLTGLPEYRNGGLLIDLGVIRLKDPEDLARTHEVSSPLVVEWRALTVALLDEVARLVRERLGCDERAMPLARVLEGGTWAAGRRIAREKRSDGSPPLSIASDGTVF